jgi:hypothetical protein
MFKYRDNPEDCARLQDIVERRGWINIIPPRVPDTLVTNVMGKNVRRTILR